MNQVAVEEILRRINELPEEDWLLLQDRLAELAEAEWKRETEPAREVARMRGINQEAIDQAIHNLRYPS